MKRIGIFVPVAYRGGTLRMAKNLCRSLRLQANANQFNLTITFFCVDNYYDMDTDFCDLQEMGIIIQETNWSVLPKEKIAEIASIANIPFATNHDEYILPIKGFDQYLECDLCLIISDRLIKPIIPLKKYAVVVFDYIQRFVPELFNNDVIKAYEREGFLPLVREAACVMCTTPSTQKDLIEYAQVTADKIRLLPFVFDPDPLLAGNSQVQPIASNYFVWVTNYSVHKNHARTLQAILDYYTVNNGSLDTVVIGIPESFAWGDLDSDKHLKEIPHLKSFLQILHMYPSLKEKVHFIGNVSDEEYANILAHAKFLLHSNLYDNGTFCVLEAAYLGTPSLSSKYAPMEYINDLAQLNMLFFNPYDHKDITNKLSQMEGAFSTISLPDRDRLNSLHWRNQSDYFYQVIQSLLD